MSSSSNLASNILNATADYKKGFGDVNALLQSIASEYGVDEKDQCYPQGFFGGDKVRENVGGVGWGVGTVCVWVEGCSMTKYKKKCFMF